MSKPSTGYWLLGKDILNKCQQANEKCMGSLQDRESTEDRPSRHA